MPSLTWKHESVNGKLRLTIEATRLPRAQDSGSPRRRLRIFARRSGESRP